MQHIFKWYQLNRLFLSLLLLLHVATIVLTPAGKNVWTKLTAAITRSNSPVLAQTVTPIPTPKTVFDQDISLQFYVAQDYTLTVEGVIELTNTSGKDMSLTEYSMNLPYFTLKNTKIGYIYPNAFLVDMYSQNNSILFTFKSQYTKPVVIGKNGKITFTFSAQVERPYRDLGGLRSLSFPFTLKDNGRSLRITVTVDDKTALIFAPNVAMSLKKKNIFTVNDETGKLFLFAISDKPFSFSLSHATEVTLPELGKMNSCATYLPVSCTGCGNISVSSNKETIAQRDKNSERVIVQLTKAINPTCTVARYKNFDSAKAKNSTYRAGYIISPALNQLLPAMWRVAKDGENESIKDISTQGVPYIYADALEYLAIPLTDCSTDDACRKIAGNLKTIDTSLSSIAESEGPGITNRADNLLSVAIKQEGRKFKLIVNNTSDLFVNISPITLEQNNYFSLSDLTGHLIQPKGSLTIPMETRVKIQTSNHDTTLVLKVNSSPMSITFKPITITILAIIEVLAYLFIVSLGITTVSVIGIILYNRIYEKRKI